MLIGFLTNAQTTFNYKGLLSDNNGPLANSTINVKVTIEAHHTVPSPGTSTLWQERHSNVHTDANGIFYIEIGTGTKIGGSAAHFYDIDWRPLFNNIRYDIDIDTGSGYHNFVSNEYFKSVPYSNYSQEAGKLKPTYNSVEIRNSASSHNGFIVNGKGDMTIGLRLRDGTDDWYTYMDANKNFVIRNDASDVFKISDADNSVWIGGELHAPSSGDADMKAYAYGYVNSNGAIVGGSDNFTVNRTATGTYEITLTGVSGCTETNCFVVAIPSNGAGNAAIRAYVYSNKIYVKTMGDTGTVQVDKKFQFVVFKK